MKIGIIGVGYVGLTTGSCFADMGNTVVCLDKDINKINNLKQGISPIYEPSLEEIIHKNLKNKNLTFTININDLLDSEIIFIAVGTPPNEDGSADLQYVKQVAKELGQVINKYCVIATKSTVPVGTGEAIKEIIKQEIKKRNLDLTFDIASNPEFLKEGSAVIDFEKPDRIIIGCENERTQKIMNELYRAFIMRDNRRILFMPIRAAEMTKYTANAMLANRISFMNEIAEICEALKININDIRKGIGTDDRIGSKFLYAGAGYGGSCFPKDVKALINIAENLNIHAEILHSVETRNKKQKELLFKKVKTYFNGNLQNKKIAFWGLSFKPMTDDIREAVSLILTDLFVEAGCTINAFDPVASNNFKNTINQEYLKNNIVNIFEDKYETLKDCDCLLLITEWSEFRNPDFEEMKKLLKKPIIFDGRNQYDAEKLKELDFIYDGIANSLYS